MGQITTKIRPFDPELTFLSGQCFRWRNDNGAWKGIADGRYAEVSGKYPDISIECKKKDLGFWENYFDSTYDYEKAERVLMRDEKISAAVKKNQGLILLRQPFFETLISFIISANNNIPRIRKIINNISEKYGEKLGQGYAFPKPETLAKLDREDLMQQNCGYRSDYIIKTSHMISDGYSHEKLVDMLLDDARAELCKFMGVGKKVADCVLIYSLGRKDAYPVDTWIRKASWEYFGKKMSDNEIRQNAAKRFGKDAALAQQYMFIAERENKTTG